MKLRHYNLESVIDFDESSIWTLVCENPRQFSQLTQDFSMMSERKDEGWMLYDGKQLDIAKYVIYLVDFHNISLNDKRSAGILQEKMKQMAFDADHTIITHEILSNITGYLNELVEGVDFPTRVNDVDLGTILKSVTISFLDESENLCEKLMDYVTLLSRLTNTRLLVCVNLRSYLDSNQLNLFFKHCEQNCIFLLCIENHYKEKMDYEKILYSDEDMCEFFPN